jgi:hypothetical protein
VELLRVDSSAEKKSASLNTRVRPELKARIAAVEARHGVPAAVMIEDAMTALCEAVEHTGTYRRPMQLVFLSSLRPCEGERWVLNEAAVKPEK